MTTNREDDIKSVLSELTRALKELQFNRKDGVKSFVPTSKPRKQVSFEGLNNYQGKNYRPLRVNNSTAKRFDNLSNRSVDSRPPVDYNYRLNPPLFCDFFSRRGQSQSECQKCQHQMLEPGQPVYCYSCIKIGHPLP